MFRNIFAIAKKDLQIERASRVVTAQILPFSFLFLILFGMAVSSELKVAGLENRTILQQTAPGLFWLIVVFSSILALSRSQSVEHADGNLDALRMTEVDSAAIFLGKSLSIFIELILLEIVIGVIAFLVYGVPLDDPILLACVVIFTTAAISFVGILYTAVAFGIKTRETTIPLLVLPGLVPVLIAASRATESAAFEGSGGNGWSWGIALGLFALMYMGLGMLSYDSLMEET